MFAIFPYVLSCVVFLVNKLCLSLFSLLFNMMFVFSCCKQQPRRSHHYSFGSTVCSFSLHSHLCLFFVLVPYFLPAVVFLLEKCGLSLFFLLVHMMLLFPICKQQTRRSCHYSFCSIVRISMLHSYRFVHVVCILDIVLVCRYVITSG